MVTVFYKLSWFLVCFWLCRKLEFFIFWFRLKINFCFMHMGVLLTCMPMSYAPAKVRRGCQNLGDGSYRCRGLNPSGIAASALNHWDVFPVPHLSFCYLLTFLKSLVFCVWLSSRFLYILSLYSLTILFVFCFLFAIWNTWMFSYYFYIPMS